MDLTFLPSHKCTFIWILEFGQLPGLRFRYWSLWMVKRQRKKRHGKGSIFLWSTGSLRDDARGVRWFAEHACHSSSSAWTHTRGGKVFLHSGHLWSSFQVTSLQMDSAFPLMNNDSKQLCLSSCTLWIAAHLEPPARFGIDILPSTLILNKGSNTTLLLFTSSLSRL